MARRVCGTSVSAAIILRVPEPSIVVTIVAATDQRALTIMVMVTVPLPQTTHPNIIPDAAMLSPATSQLHVLHLICVNHDVERCLSGLWVFKESQLGQFACGTFVVICITVAS